MMETNLTFNESTFKFNEVIFNLWNCPQNDEIRLTFDESILKFNETIPNQWNNLQNYGNKLAFDVLTFKFKQSSLNKTFFNMMKIYLHLMNQPSKSMR